MQNTVRDYQADKSKTKDLLGETQRWNFLSLDKIKDFLNEFEIDTEDGYKASKYVKQLVCRKIDLFFVDGIIFVF